MELTQKFKDILLVSDVDGTLVSNFSYYPQRNIDAIKRFQEQGGRFTIATGRHFHAVEEVVRLFEITTPLILLNGGCIYDAVTQKPIYTRYLPQSAFDHMRDISRHPQLSNIRVMAADEKAYVAYVRKGEDTNGFEYTKYKMEFKSLDELSGLELCKALLVTSEQDAAEFRSLVAELSYKDVDFVASSECYYEMMPKGINKAQGIEFLAQRLKISRCNVVAIGDYDNDLEMIKAAGLGVATANATEAVKAAAQLVVGHCKDGALADLVEYLEENLPATKIKHMED